MTVNRDWFERWHDHEDFEQRINLCRPVDDEFRDQRFKFWREAWVAAEFVKRTTEPGTRIQLRLTPEGCPDGDFELDDGKGVQPFEIAEALDGAQRPIWKKLRGAGETILPESEDSVSGAMARKLIPELILKKAAKNYPDGTGLVIYVNLWVDFEREGFGGLVPATDYKFSGIWLLASGRAIKLV